MSQMAIIMALVAVGYPIYQWRKNAFNEKSEEALRQRGFHVPPRGRRPRR